MWYVSLIISLVMPIALLASGPDFLIIGAQKAGTTALLSMVDQHPNVPSKNSAGKKVGEIHYFDVNFDKDESWYLNALPKRIQKKDRIGDKSPYYIVHPLVPERVSNTYPDVKIIVVLRNPVDRTYSHYWFNIRRGVETLTFEEALLAEGDRLQGEEERLIQDPSYISRNFREYSYLTRSRYVEQLERWLDYFPRNQILIVDASKLRKNPVETMRSVFAFLGLSDFVVNVADPEKHSDYPPIDPAMRQTLVDYFQPYNERLESLLDYKFNWH